MLAIPKFKPYLPNLKSTMKRLLILSTIFIYFVKSLSAQTANADVSKVLEAEKNFAKLVEAKGIKGGFLDVTDPEGIVFKPTVVKIVDFYKSIENQAGTLTWTPQFARISQNGDLAVTAGPYVYQNGKSDTDKVFGEYVSVWRTDLDNKFKLLIDLGIQHPEPETVEKSDFKNPSDSSKIDAAGKDPFSGKKIILATDNAFNYSLSESTIAAYNEFLSPNSRYYFPGFDPITGPQSIMKFINNEGITMTAENTSAGRSSSNDLAYSYGTARIKKGYLVHNYNYVRIWEMDKEHKWNILLEILSPLEND